MIVESKNKIKVAIFAHQKGNIEIDIPASMRPLEPGEQLQTGQRLFRILNQKDGDKRIVWNAEYLEEIDEAKQMFNKLVEEGLVPYRVDPSGRKTPDVIREFDPKAEEIIFAPIAALVGG